MEMVEIYNLSNDTIHRIKRGETCTIEAGYRGDYGVIASGKVTSVMTRREGVDKITTITVMEGDDYSRVKVDKKNSTDKKSLKIAMRDYDMSTHDISTICRTSLGVGMLVPFCKILCQKGDIIDLNLINKTLAIS